MNNTDLWQMWEQLKLEYAHRNKSLDRVAELYVAEKWNCAKLANGIEGKAFNFSGHHGVYGDLLGTLDLQMLATLQGAKAEDAVLQLLETPGISHRAFCLAILNGLALAIYEDWSYQHFEVLTDLVDSESVVTQIGCNGFADTLAKTVKQIFVSDMRPQAGLWQQFFADSSNKAKITLCSAEANKKILQASDVVIFSGCTIVNQTYLDILKWSSAAQARVIFGPSAHFLPDYLGNLGVTHIYNQEYKIVL